MRILTILIVVIALSIVGVVIWKFMANPPQEQVQQEEARLSKHSEAFNESVDSALNRYYAMTNAFVEWDSVAVEKLAASLLIALDNIKLDLLKDTTGVSLAKDYLEKSKTDLYRIVDRKNITAKREVLHSLTEFMYSFLQTIEYDKEKLYLQNCPMAFNDEEDGTWISRVPEIRNPYLGLYDPKYGRGMLKCGDTKDTLKF